MSPKDKRDRLFRKGKPTFRLIEILDGEQYGKDMGYLWAAYKAGSFKMAGGFNESQFASEIEKLCSEAKVWMAEDKNKSFRSGAGPVAMLVTLHNGLIVEPRAVHFKWASKKNIVRVVVGFLNMLRYSKKTGICMVKSNKEDVRFFQKMKGFDVLHYMGKPSDTEYLFSVRGRGSD